MRLPGFSARKATQRQTTGAWGERIVVRYLRQQGMRIWFHDWRYKRYQVDIIALTGNQLIIVEVKTRHSFTTFSRDDAFSDTQREHLAAAIVSFEDQYALALKRARIREVRLLAITVLVPGMFRWAAPVLAIQEISRGPLLKNWWTGHNS